VESCDWSLNEFSKDYTNVFFVDALGISNMRFNFFRQNNSHDTGESVKTCMSHKILLSTQVTFQTLFKFGITKKDSTLIHHRLASQARVAAATPRYIY